MRESVTSIQLWSYSLLIVVLSPLAVYLGPLWGWTPGAASLALLAAPVCAVALSGNRTAALAAAALAGCSSFVESVVAESVSGGGGQFTFALFATCVLVAVTSLVAIVAERLRNRVSQLEEQNSQYVRDLYQKNRDEETTASKQSAKSTNSTDHAGGEEESDSESVNYPMLLLTLQDIGRRVSTNLDFETLIPTIISTARASLPCSEAQVYAWNAQEQTLKNTLPARARDRLFYVPRPQTGMAHWVLEHKQILTRQTIEDDYALQGLLEEDPGLPDAIAPLTVGGELLGLLVVDKIEQDSQTFVRLLYILANIYAMGIKNAQLFKRIEEMARRDGLTGLLNHASFQQELQKLVEQASADQMPLTVIMSDIDHFKKFNDRHGHQAGDHVLREVSRLWSYCMPDYAVVARYGGEEFICALPQDNLERGRELAELLRTTTEERTIEFEGRELNVAASFGVAEFGRGANTSQDLIKLADAALYEAKDGGRNRVVCSDSTLAASNTSEDVQPIHSH